MMLEIGTITANVKPRIEFSFPDINGCTACEGKGFIQGFEAHGVIASKSLAKPKIVTCPKCNGTGRR